jgi:rubrerythrin
MDVQKILTPILELENRMSDLYTWYSEVFSEDAEVASLFYRMARDEKSHAALVQYERRILRQQKGGAIDVGLTLKELQETACELGVLLTMKTPPSLQEALGTAYRLETSAAENHLRDATVDILPGLGKLLANLGQEDRKHVEGLKTLAAKRGVSLGGGEPIP